MAADEQPIPTTPASVPPATESPPHTAGTVEKLEDKIKELGHGASEAVTGAIKGVKDGAHAVQDAIGHAAKEAVASAKNALDLTRHVRRYPWLAVGCAVALGFACSRFTDRR